MKLRHAALALALLIMAGCGGVEVVAPSAPAPAVASSSPTGLLPEKAYLDLVRANTNWWDGVPDDKLLESSQLVCDVLEEALTDDQFFKAFLGLLKTSLDNGMEAGEAGSYITFAASQYCPGQVERLENLPGA